jgi:hypothetical protein
MWEKKYNELQKTQIEIDGGDWAPKWEDEGEGKPEQCQGVLLMLKG